jgi:hypothetical protein
VRVHGLGLRHALVGGVLALVPFGPVVLEWRWRKTGVLAGGDAAGS